MNNSLLDDPPFYEEISNLIESMKTALTPHRDPVRVWELIKKATKGSMRRYRVCKAKSARDKKERLKQELEILAA